MTNMRYGIKEVANVIFFDTKTNKPVLFFDTLKVSSIENEAETAEARGGQGNNKLMAWDYGRTANLTMQDALLSDNSLAMLAGTAVKKSGINVVEREALVVEGGAIELKQTPVAGKTFVYSVENGVMSDELEIGAVTDKSVAVGTVEVPVADGTEVIAFYEYASAEGEATQVSFTGRDFPSTYRVVGDTIVRDEEGNNRRMQFVIAKAKLASTFSLTMDVENVSTFDFNLEILVDTSNKEFKLYDIIRL